MAWREDAGKYHDYLVDALLRHEHSVLTKNGIFKLLTERFPEFKGKKDWILISAHCINGSERGGCYCASSQAAIFERMGCGKYRVRKPLHKFKSEDPA